jgi:MinD superfamily P-loop ATPase
VDLAVAVTEPTLSGLHDFKRIAQLARQFNVPVAACVNKFDLNEEMTASIEGYCASNGVAVLGRIPYDSAVIGALSRGEIFVNSGRSETVGYIQNIWEKVLSLVRG